MGIIVCNKWESKRNEAKNIRSVAKASNNISVFLGFAFKRTKKYTKMGHPIQYGKKQKK